MKTIVRVFGDAVVDAPNWRALIRAENWHRRRLAALTEQVTRSSVVLNPRRVAELHEQIEGHNDAIRDIRAGKAVIEAARVVTPPVSGAEQRTAHNDAVMATDWRNALAAIEAGLDSRNSVVK